MGDSVGEGEGGAVGASVGIADGHHVVGDGLGLLIGGSLYFGEGDLLGFAVGEALRLRFSVCPPLGSVVGYRCLMLGPIDGVDVEPSEGEPVRGGTVA